MSGTGHLILQGGRGGAQNVSFKTTSLLEKMEIWQKIEVSSESHLVGMMYDRAKIDLILEKKHKSVCLDILSYVLIEVNFVKKKSRIQLPGIIQLESSFLLITSFTSTRLEFAGLGAPSGGRT